MRGFFEDIRRSITDFAFYREIKAAPAARAVKYICLLLLVITLLLSVRFMGDMGRALGMLAQWSDENLPVITIKDGVVSAEVDQPFIVEDENFAMIIDTTGGITNLDGYRTGFLVTKDSVIYKENEVKSESYSLKDVKALTIDQKLIKTLQRSLPWIALPFMIIFMYLYFIIARALQVLLFSLVTLLTASILKVQLAYKEAVNIGIFALTPSMLLGALFPLLGIVVPFFVILYVGIYTIMIVMAVMNCREGSAA